MRLKLWVRPFDRAESAQIHHQMAWYRLLTMAPGWTIQTLRLQACSNWYQWIWSNDFLSAFNSPNAQVAPLEARRARYPMKPDAGGSMMDPFCWRCLPCWKIVIARIAKVKLQRNILWSETVFHLHSWLRSSNTWSSWFHSTRVKWN